MKRIIQQAALVILVMLGSAVSKNTFAQYYDGYDRDRDVTYQDFYDDLSPYGDWVEYPGQGYVWVPKADDDFRPYSTNGHWVWTEDYEWMWVSDYDWGWAPFHYGRWDYDDYYGWFWVPGYEWSPAWVAWRDGGDYYGWAPIRPGINININFNFGNYNPPNDFWCFAPRRYINSPRIWDYCVDRRQNYSIINITTVINFNNYRSGYGFRNGPRRYDAEIYCGRINPVRVYNSYSPGRSVYRNNEVNIYRPLVRRDEGGRNYAPRQFERYDRDRTNGSFRDRNNNGDFRRNDNNNGRGNDGGFRRPGDRDRVDNNRSFDRRDDNNGRGNNGGFRRDDNVRQPQQDNNNNDRRFDRNNNPGNGQPTDRRFERPQRNFDPGSQPQQDPRRFDRPQRNVDPNPQPQQDPRRFDRPQRNIDPGTQPQQDPRRFDRPQVDNSGNGGRGREIRSDDNWRRQQPQQQPTERRVEQPQQQPRQFERRNDDGGRQRENGSGNGGGNGRGRRF